MGKKPDITPFDKIKLVDLPRALASSGVNTTYTACYMGVLNNHIPAARNSTGGRWLIDKKDLPQIIKTFSLLEKSNDKDQERQSLAKIKARQGKRRS